MQKHHPFLRFFTIFALVGGLIFFFSKPTPPPKNLSNICTVLRTHPKWYWASKAARKRWGVPISIQMAFIYKESHFRSEAKPKRKRLLGLIPWTRPTSATGYAQAVNHTWRVYLRETHQRSARRDDFATATDFIGWYLNRLHHRLGIPKDNAYKLYLAYHEGGGGYKRGTYRKQTHLIQIAHHVQARATRYHQQLLHCEKHLPKKHWFNWM